VVLNQYLNVSRKKYDQLKAILHNCGKKGSATQNRENLPDFRASLLGRISHLAMITPARGEKLLAIFRQIDWSDCDPFGPSGIDPGGNLEHNS
jgi:RNA-directed DNA polymerase